MHLQLHCSMLELLHRSGSLNRVYQQKCLVDGMGGGSGQGRPDIPACFCATAEDVVELAPPRCLGIIIHAGRHALGATNMFWCHSCSTSDTRLLGPAAGRRFNKDGHEAAQAAGPEPDLHLAQLSGPGSLPRGLKCPAGTKPEGPAPGPCGTPDTWGERAVAGDGADSPCRTGQSCLSVVIHSCIPLQLLSCCRSCCCDCLNMQKLSAWSTSTA